LRRDLERRGRKETWRGDINGDESSGDLRTELGNSLAGKQKEAGRKIQAGQIVCDCLPDCFNSSQLQNSKLSTSSQTQRWEESFERKSRSPRRREEERNTETRVDRGDIYTLLRALSPESSSFTSTSMESQLSEALDFRYQIGQ
jgi:hypothetical protein